MRNLDCCAGIETSKRCEHGFVPWHCPHCDLPHPMPLAKMARLALQALVLVPLALLALPYFLASEALDP